MGSFDTVKQQQNQLQLQQQRRHRQRSMWRYRDVHIKFDCKENCH